MVSSWPVKKINIYPLFNVHNKQIIKVTHTSQALFFFEILVYLTEIGKCHFPSPVHKFFLFIINLRICPTYIKGNLYPFH